MSLLINSVIIFFGWLLTPKYWFRISPKILIIQAYHETGGFTSNIFKENFNYFGMKQPSRRETKVIGTSRGHGVFKSRWSSVIDLFLWFDFHDKNNKVPDIRKMGEYVKFLAAKGYAEDAAYSIAMSRVENSLGSKIKKIFLLVILPLPIIVIGGLGYVLLKKKGKGV